MRYDCSKHGEDVETICIHPRLGIYTCKECYEEWPNPTITISNIPYDENNKFANSTDSNSSISYIYSDD